MSENRLRTGIPESARKPSDVTVYSWDAKGKKKMTKLRPHTKRKNGMGFGNFKADYFSFD